jgi:hypothetical protein
VIAALLLVHLAGGQFAATNGGLLSTIAMKQALVVAVAGIFNLCQVVELPSAGIYCLSLFLGSLII